MKVKVRLTEEEIRAIREVAKEVFGEGVKVWLFGSRTDLTKRGGDIDLYIEVPFEGDMLDKKLTFLVRLEDRIGEQRIDLIIRKPDADDEIAKTAKRGGVRLL
ncbi:MAG TPA: nucleotidyltransferase domain-containing protein [Aquifex sp.]|nr:nucleotidyltransferase domain-containing protein [Aquifex sp.]